MSVNENEKILTWTWMRCVRTCLLADALPANADECKQKQKKYLPDGECGCVAFVRAGVTDLRLCKMLHMHADADGGGWAVVVADGTNACKENRTKKKEKNKKLTSGT